MASGVGPLPDASVAETDLLYLGYTSGTTGRPKGAMVTQRNRVLAYHYWAIEFGLTADDVMLHCAPFHHSAPFTFVLSQLYIGGQVVILDHFDANACLDASRELESPGRFGFRSCRSAFSTPCVSLTGDKISPPSG
jgi:long-chain acyl-CoA synthetase